MLIEENDDWDGDDTDTFCSGIERSDLVPGVYDLEVHAYNNPFEGPFNYQVRVAGL